MINELRIFLLLANIANCQLCNDLLLRIKLIIEEFFGP